MKSKNKFTANLKSNKYTNVIIISLIIGFSIYLLYFNTKIHVQDTIVDSLNENNERVVENFDVSKYIDVCKHRNTRFYNLKPSSTSTSRVFAEVQGITDLTNCEKHCTDTSCHVFTFKDNKCYRYKGTLNSSTNIDTRYPTDPITNPIKINCDSKIYTNYGGLTYDTYNGIGYINKTYFNNNKRDLSYIDPYLVESNIALNYLNSLDISRNRLRESRSTANSNNLRNQIQNGYNELFLKFSDWNDKIFDIDSDNSRNVLYTDMFNGTRDICNSILAPVARDISFVISLDNSFNMSNKYDNLGRLIDGNIPKFISSNLRYLILAFIMIITIIVLILYKSSTLINEKVLIIYIIIITIMVLFITHYLKL